MTIEQIQHARTTITRPSTLTTLQAGRGLAAMLVVLFHATGLFASKDYWDTDILHGLFGFGHAGVEFFFALSGFIMILVHRNDIGHPDRVHKFVTKRIMRIYPIYWAISIFVTALYIASSNAQSENAYNSIFLIGYDNNAVLSVAWTLFHEVFFYIIFTFLILNRNIGAIIFTLWFAICLIWITEPAPYYGAASINIVFGFGMLAAFGYKYMSKPKLILIISVSLFLILGCEEVFLNLIVEDARTLAYGAIAAIAIAAAVSAESKALISSSKWMTALGDSSYSLYLVHYPVLAITARLWLATPLRILPNLLAFCALIGVAVIAGFATHRLVEKPLMFMFSKRRP